MSSIEFIRAEIERIHVQIIRQQKDIVSLQRSGKPTESAETLLERMRASATGLCRKRDWMQQQSAVDASAPRHKEQMAVQ
jgi:hypothetical protein